MIRHASVRCLKKSGDAERKKICRSQARTEKVLFPLELNEMWLGRNYGFNKSHGWNLQLTANFIRDFVCVCGVKCVLWPQPRAAIYGQISKIVVLLVNSSLRWKSSGAFVRDIFSAQKNQHPHVADTGQKLIRFRFPASDQEDQAKRNGRFDDDHESAPCNLCSSEPDV